LPAVTVRDETTSGRAIDTWLLPGLPESITARELVRLRVREEVARYNSATPEYFRGLVQPIDAEATLNGYRLRQRRKLRWEVQAQAGRLPHDVHGQASGVERSARTEQEAGQR